MRELVVEKWWNVQRTERNDLPFVVHVPGLMVFNGIEIPVPFGYMCDLASVPRIPFVYARYGGRADIPAVGHDLLYDCFTDQISRADADWIFWRLMELRNDPERWSPRYMMWLGTRVGGWRGWHRDTTWKCKQ